MGNRVLIVEDEVELAANYKEILINLDYEVVAIAKNATDCLEVLRNEEVDLILMDVMIEGDIDGIELTYQIKSEWDIPVVFTTAYSDQGILERISKVIYDGYLLKPFSVDRLQSTIFLALNDHKPDEDKGGFFKVRDKGFVVPIPHSEIIYFQADGLYTKIFTRLRSYAVRDILKNIEAKLENGPFLRVHKSYVVNLQNVTSFNYKSVFVHDKIIPIRRGVNKLIDSHLS